MPQRPARLALLLLVTTALLLFVGQSPAQAGKLTPEQKRGLALVKDARRVGRSFRKAQKSANKAFGRASRKLAGSVNRGKTTGSEAFTNWISLFETLLLERTVRREAAYAEYEALYGSAGLSAAKTSVSIAGNEDAQRGSGTGLAGDSFHRELVVEAREFGDSSADAFGRIADACDEDGNPIAGRFAADAPAHPTARSYASHRPIVACVGNSDGSALCAVEFTFEPPSRNTAFVQLFKDSGEFIATQSVQDAANATLLRFEGLEPGEYYFLVEVVNVLAIPSETAESNCSFTIPARPEPDQGGGGTTGKSSATGTIEGAPLGTPDVVGVDVRMKGNVVEALQVLCADTSLPNGSPNLFVSLFHTGAGFAPATGVFEVGVGNVGQTVADATYDPDGFSEAPALLSVSGTFEIKNLKALTDLSKPGTATVSFDGTVLDIRGGAGGPKAISFKITLSNKDLPKLPGPSKGDAR